MPIGEALRNARLKKDYSFEYLEESTKIRTKYLKALEEEKFDVLPGPVYAKAFLRTYAKFLELDTEEIMQEYNMLTNNNPAPAVETKEIEPVSISGGSKKWRYLAAGAAVVALLAFNAFYDSNKRAEDNKPELPQTVQENTVEQKGNSNNSPQLSTPQPVQGVRVVLKVNDNPSWMQVVADGNTIFSGTVAPGEMKDFQAEEKIFLHVGNAGAVEVNVNGKNLGRMGALGKVEKKTFTVDDDPNMTRG
ncbi:helix-turn-helix domain-containing protein [Desulforamulus ferrireducens]|uniref:Helix-turn-helix domain-containing protein n=1 Tax=Desulforamulus ferrireducens TaxID=1833852 RepID=A0A1S6IX20_9FIRM|nr:helix-turn-helix domain-containing protein [Desulforamulus ferrireducens]